MTSVIALGAVQAYLDRYALGTKFHNGVYDGKVTLAIDQKGFKSITSVFSSESMSFASKMVPNAVKMVRNRIVGDLSSDLFKYKDELINYLDDIRDFDTLSWDRAQIDQFICTYSKESGKLTFFTAMFDPDFSSDKVTFRYIKIEVKMQLPGIFVIGMSAKGNFFGVSVKQSLEKIEGSLTLNHVIDALVIALAPGMIGLVDLPPTFVQRIMKAAENQLASSK